MSLHTQEGVIRIWNRTPDSYIGVYQPRDGRDALLYTLPGTGISVMKVIPPVRNKVNTTDLGRSVITTEMGGWGAERKYHSLL